MNYFELHDKATELVATTTHYELARMYIELKGESEVEEPTCRGSVYLGTGCGNCKRCRDEMRKMQESKC